MQCNAMATVYIFEHRICCSSRQARTVTAPVKSVASELPVGHAPANCNAYPGCLSGRCHAWSCTALQGPSGQVMRARPSRSRHDACYAMPMLWYCTYKLAIRVCHVCVCGWSSTRQNYYQYEHEQGTNKAAPACKNLLPV